MDWLLRYTRRVMDPVRLVSDHCHKWPCSTMIKSRRGDMKYSEKQGLKASASLKQVVHIKLHVGLSNLGLIHYIT